MDNQVIRRPQDNRGNIVLYFVILLCLVIANAIDRSMKPDNIFDRLFIYALHLFVGIMLYVMLNIKGETCYLVENRFVKKNLTYKDIIPDRRLSLAPNERHFHNPVLVYISPGSRREYGLALEFTSKFTHISPEWYELRSDGKAFYLEGENNVDQGWIRQLRRKGDVLVLPRIVVQVSSDNLLDKNDRERAIDVVVKECRKMGYHGVVLESWSKWKDDDILGIPNSRRKAIAFIKELGHRLHRMSPRLDLIFITHPPRDHVFGRTDFRLADVRSLGNDVDGYSLLTHAFSGVGSPGPNAPLQWINATLEEFLGPNKNDKVMAQKLFIGLGFNGRDYLLAGGGGENDVAVITSTEYRNVVAQHQPRMSWDQMSGEHHFIYLDEQLRTHAVFYPSLQSVWMRLGEAKKMGTGVAIHQLEAGFDSFLGLL